MEIRRHAGPLFEEGDDGDGDGRLAGGLSDLLDARDTLVEIDRGDPPRVVLGVPHHAAPGVDRIAERRPEGGRVADENAALYALVALGRLASLGVPARLLVAAHATDHDPNKSARSPYCRRVLDCRAELLIECHGAGARAPHDLELSAGRNALADPLRFSRGLLDALGPGFHLAAQSLPGQRAAVLMDARGRETGAAVLRFPALRTRSLAAAGEVGMAALHLEAKPRFRSRVDGRAGLPPPGRRLGEALARAAAAYLAG
ncbi:MAG: hypothetical protein ACQGVC_11190 [Myxococcota bacterium]